MNSASAFLLGERCRDTDFSGGQLLRLKALSHGVVLSSRFALCHYPRLVFVLALLGLFILVDCLELWRSRAVRVVRYRACKATRLQGLGLQADLMVIVPFALHRLQGGSASGLRVGVVVVNLLAFVDVLRLVLRPDAPRESLIMSNS